MKTVVVVDDHTLVRQSLVKTINGDAGFSVSGEASTGEEACAVILRTKPNIALLDIKIPAPDGIEVARTVRSDLPELKVVFLTMHDDDSSITRASEVGADGYLPKTVSASEVVQALRTVSEGGTFIHFSVARRLAEISRLSSSATVLVGRELEILRLLSEGLRPQEVAERLHLSIKTVKNHLTIIYMKLDVQSGAQAVVEAYRRGLVPMP